ncbi:DUF6752 domain-containing protein [Nocardioides sp. Bht2]|uniref:DUF6752 domain-containing protein n=1 Tax=Nocardioides sp. Bht2 TaxID=3392297 RepID=UPI0039B6B5C9
MTTIEAVGPLSRARQRLALRSRLRRAQHLASRAREHNVGVLSRLRALEDEVQEQRQLNRRIAELTDVVAELLVPAADRDEAKVQEVLEKYRTELV